MPEPTIWRFRQNRDYFLERRGYTEDRLHKLIDYYCEEGIPTHRYHPNGELVDRDAMNIVLGFLANLRWIVSLGQSKGLTELANTDAADAALGRSQRMGAKQSRKDTLRKYLETVYPKLRESLGYPPKNEDMLQFLESNIDHFNGECPIDEVDREAKVIHWFDRRDKPRQTRFGTFYDRMTDIRKVFSEK